MGIWKISRVPTEICSKSRVKKKKVYPWKSKDWSMNIRQKVTLKKRKKRFSTTWWFKFKVRRRSWRDLRKISRRRSHTRPGSVSCISIDNSVPVPAIDLSAYRSKGDAETFVLSVERRGWQRCIGLSIGLPSQILPGPRKMKTRAPATHSWHRTMNLRLLSDRHRLRPIPI